MISYEQIEKVNVGLKTIDQKGKPYVTVDERVKAFRILYPEGTIETEMLYYQDGRVVFKATAYDADGKKLATGHSEEIEGSNFVNKTSFVENAETSAVGRMLGMMYLGANGSIASFDEVKIAQDRQANNAVSYRSKLLAYCNAHQLDLREIADKYGLKPKAPEREYKRVYEELANGKA